MRDFTDDLRELHRRVSDANGYLRIAALRERLGALEADASRPDLWDDVDAARRVTTELAQVKEQLRKARLALGLEVEQARLAHADATA